MAKICILEEEGRSGIIDNLTTARTGYNDCLPLSGEDLIRFILYRADLPRSEMHDAELVSLYYIKLKGDPNLTKSPLYSELQERFKVEGINAIRTLNLSISNSVLKGISLPCLGLGLKVYKCDLEGADFSGSVLSSSSFYNSFLRRVNLTKAILFKHFDTHTPSFTSCDLRDIKGLEEAHGITDPHYIDCLMSPPNIETILKAYAAPRFRPCGELDREESARLKGLEASGPCCGQCDALHDQPHKLGCDHEMCATCGDQIFCCDCKKKKQKKRPFDKEEILSSVRDNLGKLQKMAKKWH